MLLRELKRNDFSLVLGTDVGPTYLSLVPGFSALDELRVLADCGFSPYEAIATATRSAGEVAGRMIGRNEFGTIEVGKRADFILLEKNPLEDVGNVRNPLGVMAAGRWLPRDTLQMLLAIRHASILDSLTAACTRSGSDTALEEYRRFTESNFYNEYRYGVGALNQVGYQLMGEGRIEDALRVLRLNMEEYPADWNVFDSYGEACMKAGKKELAIESYERALALDPSQENPRNMLRRLRQE